MILPHIVLLLSASPAAPTGLSAQVPAPPEFSVDDSAAYGNEIAFYVDRRDAGWFDEVSQGNMTLFDAGGDSVRRSFQRMALENSEGDKVMTKFLSPAEIKGVAALTHENPGSSDDNWLYLPSNKRVRRISGANNTASFQGTEFTYEDLASIDPREYEWRFLEATELDRDMSRVPVFKLHAKPTYADTGYSHIEVFVHSEHWRFERIDYFDLAGRPLKTRDSSQWKQHHDRYWREQRLEMTNHQTGKRTLLEQSKQFLNLSLYKSSKTGKARPNLTADRFTTRALEN